MKKTNCFVTRSRLVQYINFTKRWNGCAQNIYCKGHIRFRDGLSFYHPQNICFPGIFRNISCSTWLSEESRNSATGNECISLKSVQAQMTHQTVHSARTIRSESSNELASYLGSWPSTANETSKHHIVYIGKTAVNALFAEDFFW